MTTRTAPSLHWAVGVLVAGALSGCVRPERDQSKESAAQPAPAQPAPAQPAPAQPPPSPTPPPRGKIDRITEVVGEDLLARLRASHAKGSVVNAWASWCGPCKEEFPMLVQMQAELAPRGIAVVFVSVDEPETHAAAQAFAEENGLSGELLVAKRPLGPFKKALDPEWPGMLPATFLFDGAPRLRHFWGGPIYRDELSQLVEGFLAGRPIDGRSTPGLSPGLDLRP